MFCVRFGMRQMIVIRRCRGKGLLRSVEAQSSLRRVVVGLGGLQLST